MNDRVAHLVRTATASSSNAAYATQIGLYGQLCQKEGVQPFPVRANTLYRFAALAGSEKTATVAISAVKKASLLIQRPFPENAEQTLSHIKRGLSKIANTNKKTAAKGKEMEAILAELEGEPEQWLHFATMFVFALRPAELATVERGQVKDDRNEDISPADIKGRTAVMVFQQEKVKLALECRKQAQKTGDVVVRTCSCEGSRGELFRRLCPVHNLAKEYRKTERGEQIFPTLRTYAAQNKAFNAAVERALPEKKGKITLRSLRMGAVQELEEHGATPGELLKAGNWSAVNKYRDLESAENRAWKHAHEADNTQKARAKPKTKAKPKAKTTTKAQPKAKAGAQTERTRKEKNATSVKK